MAKDLIKHIIVLEGAIEILKTMDDAESKLKRLGGAARHAEEEIKKYDGYVKVAKRDAEIAEDESILRINNANARALRIEESSKAREESANDRAKIAEDHANEECNRLGNMVLASRQKTSEIINTVNAEAEVATTKKDQILGALKKVRELAEVGT